MGYEGNVKWAFGTDKASDGAADKTLITAQGAGSIIHVTKVYLTLLLSSDGGDANGLVAVEDGVGGTRFIEAHTDDRDPEWPYLEFNFEPYGYPLTANTLLNLTVDTASGAGATQATVAGTAIGWVAGA